MSAVDVFCGSETVRSNCGTLCIPSKANRKVPIPYDPALYRQRYKIEHMFGGLNEWRRIHT